MSFEVFWFLPTSGDTRHLGQSDFGRTPTIDYLRSIAVTSENLGYGLNRMALYRHIILPGALPDILTGVRIGLGVGWSTLVAAELVMADSKCLKQISKQPNCCLVFP